MPAGPSKERPGKGRQQRRLAPYPAGNTPATAAQSYHQIQTQRHPTGNAGHPQAHSTPARSSPPVGFQGAGPSQAIPQPTTAVGSSARTATGSSTASRGTAPMYLTSESAKPDPLGFRPDRDGYAWVPKMQGEGMERRPVKAGHALYPNWLEGDYVELPTTTWWSYNTQQRLYLPIKDDGRN